MTAVLTRSQRRILARQIVARMLKRGDPVTATAAWSGVRVAIKNNPLAFIQVLDGEAGKRNDAQVPAIATIEE